MKHLLAKKDLSEFTEATGNIISRLSFLTPSLVEYWVNKEDRLEKALAQALARPRYGRIKVNALFGLAKILSILCPAAKFDDSVINQVNFPFQRDDEYRCDMVIFLSG